MFNFEMSNAFGWDVRRSENNSQQATGEAREIESKERTQKRMIQSGELNSD